MALQTRLRGKGAGASKDLITLIKLDGANCFHIIACLVVYSFARLAKARAQPALPLKWGGAI